MPIPDSLTLLRAVRRLLLVAVVALTGCAAWRGIPGVDPWALLPADAILLGEQHDAPEHHQVHVQVIRSLARRDQLAAVVLEMAERGHGTTILSRRADDAAVREALQWNEPAWPWARYGPAVMAAVRAGIPVVGSNLPRTRLHSAMADPTLDGILPPAAWQAQQDAIRVGHCDLLASSQLAPMARIQVARDQTMAQTLQAAARPGKVVLLLTGSGHADRQLGVPRHLPAGFTVRAVRLLAGGPADGPKASPSFDAIWATPPVPEKDHCAELRRRFSR